MANSSPFFQALSDDILYIIFTYATPVSMTSSTQINIRRMPPLNFSQVCRTWRFTVQAHPNLWTMISITYTIAEDDRSSNPIILPFVKKWLQRSPSTPIYCHLDLYGYEFRTDFVPLLDFLQSENHRWKDMDIGIRPHRINIWNRDPIAICCTPALSSFRLNRGGVFSNFRTHPPVSLDLTSFAMDACSHLRVLDVSSGVKWLLPEKFSLPSLQELRICTDLGHDTTAILSACPGISSLHIFVKDEALDHKVKSRVTVLSHLAFLEIRSSNDARSKHIINTLSCPSLQSLAFNESGELREIVALQSLRSITAFLSRSNVHRSLVELRIQFYCIPTTNIDLDSRRENIWLMVDLLRSLANLERLFLSGFIVDEDIVRLLTVHPKGLQEDFCKAAVCPLLREMMFTFTNLGRFGRGAMGAMIASRWEATKKLRSVTLSFAEFPDFAHENERVRVCMEEGLILLAF
ncbi:hypothetical protein SCHPADRAFT_910485 [Schizopora paradoxa]|uniref:F-box domain-containing protein n=1 Tax=Schizopora paradoxa TaxID=27342 RepID=A0A0H2RMY0_9AGAM|nr:hypothetical protein SCHPADRAFT_910485 [Schizopora paradoxa]